MEQNPPKLIKGKFKMDDYMKRRSYFLLLFFLWLLRYFAPASFMAVVHFMFGCLLRIFFASAMIWVPMVLMEGMIMGLY